jgi:hypothetical protein
MMEKRDIQETSLQEILPTTREDSKTTEARGIHHLECSQFRIIHAEIAYFVSQATIRSQAVREDR